MAPPHGPRPSFLGRGCQSPDAPQNVHTATIMADLPSAPTARFQRHPLVESIPTLPPTSEGYQQIRSSIMADGIREPLKCERRNDDLLVVDGLHRLAIAHELGLEQMPYVEVAASDVVTVICSSLVRADWTKSALAYRMWPLFALYACQRGGDRKSKGNHFPLISISEIAEKIGVSEKLLDQAKRIHCYFAKNPSAREAQEPQILTGKLPLHKAGSDGKLPAFPEPLPIRAIETTLSRLPKSFHRWEQVSHSDRERAKNQLATALHQLPKDVQETAIDALEIALGR